MNEAGCQTCLFRQEICKVISNDDFSEIQNNTVQLSYADKEVIIKQGTNLSQILYLTQGFVIMEYMNEKMQTFIKGILKAPMLICGGGFFTMDKNQFSIISVGSAQCCMIDTRTLRLKIAANGGFGIKIYELLETQNNELLKFYKTIVGKRVNGRVAGLLLFLMRDILQTEEARIPLNRKQLSLLAGCSEENLIGILKSFNENGIIHTNAKKIKLIDVEMLKKIRENG